VTIIERGDWVDFRHQLNLHPENEIDLHFGKRAWGVSYDDAMAEVQEIVRQAVIDAARRGRPYVMFIHGNSTSRNGATTARSVVRGFMRSKAATPFIDRAGCVQHQTVFVAKLRAD
jgi:hypothetical protein